MNLTVPEQKTPIRLDKFLIEQFPHTSRNFWREHLEKWVKVNGKKPAKGHLLKGGEKLFLQEIPPAEIPKLSPNPKIVLSVLFEDDFLFAIDKPAGLPCLPVNAEEQETVVHGVLARFTDQAKVDPESWEGGLIHRLDNQTSGVLLFAKTSEVKEKLSQLNQEGKITKEYLAWVEGVVTQDGTINLPIAHHPKNPRKMIIPESEKEAKKFKARPAMTQYEVLKKTPTHTLLRIGIHRGARHQIRIHLASRGHPVVGDALYGKASDGTYPRHLLHASEIFFHHPMGGKKVRIISPVPIDFRPM